jgi:DNA mismatch endonuclease (patch repair protein)
MPRIPSSRSSLPSSKSIARGEPTELARSANMAKIRGRDTSPETMLRKALWHNGLRFRVNFRVLKTRPDIVFTARKLAVFVDGCFWHGCPQHYVMPRTRTAFWSDKLKTNTTRDREQTINLTENGWRVLRFWEHEVETDLVRVAEDVAYAYFDPLIPFKDRTMVVNVEPVSSDGALERWHIENLMSDRATFQELRTRTPKKLNLHR